MAIEKNSPESDDKPKKPKRVLSDKQKEALKKGREKRHELMKNPKKSLLTKENKTEIIPNNEVVESKESFDDFSKSQDEPVEKEIVYRKKPKQEKKPKKPKKQVVIIEESESSSSEEDDEPIIVRRSSRKKKETPPPPPQPSPPRQLKESPKINTLNKPRKKILFS